MKIGNIEMFVLSLMYFSIDWGINSLKSTHYYVWLRGADLRAASVIAVRQLLRNTHQALSKSTRLCQTADG